MSTVILKINISIYFKLYNYAYHITPETKMKSKVFKKYLQ